MAISKKDELYEALKKAFPMLPKYIISLEIRLAVNSIPIVKCEFYPDVETVEQLVPLFAQFELHAKK